MSFSKSLLFLIYLISDINTAMCVYEEHPIVQNIKEILKSKQVSEKCVVVLRIFIKKIDEEIWASEMLDATSKVPTWIGSYNYVDLGHFSQCIQLESKRDNIKGQYCIGNVAINASMVNFYKATIYKQEFKQLEGQIFEGKDFMSHSLTWSMCLPSNCSIDDVSIIMNKLQLFGFGLKNISCQTIEDVNPMWTRDAFIGISILGILTFIILISTSYDIYWQNKKTAHPGLIAFSIYTNGKKLCEIPKRSSSLSCLDGIKVLSMVWIIIVHTCSFHFSGPVFSSKDNENLPYYIITRIFMNGHLACDTFLIVGGTLVTYVYFKKFKGKNLTFPGILKHYFHRYIRLTPPLAGLVLVYSTLLRYMGSGPNWPYSAKSFEDSCKTNWWYQLLYIQNQIQDKIICIGHTWYLDVDMQLYIFSPLIFWILSKYTKIGFILLIIATFSSISLSFFIAYKNELSAIQPNPYPKIPYLDYFNKYYVKTQTRAAPWIIGTILGYILTQKSCTSIRLSKKITIPLWILTFSVILLCIFIGFDSLRGPEYYKFPNAFHIALIRPSFALAIGWIIWACFTNHGGIVNSILSLSIFQFMNKFILSMYLIHPLCLYIIVQSSKNSLYISNFNLVYWFWGTFMLTFGLSVIWILVFESPVHVLEKIIFPSKSQKEEIGKPETKATD